MVLDPLGASAKVRLSDSHSMSFSLGPDYFGSPRLQADYLWDFKSMRNGTITPYAGPGLAVAMGKGITPFFSKEMKREWFADIEDRGRAFGGRAIFGLNYTPERSPLEFFFEAGPLVPFTKVFDVDIDAGLGARYYL